jgi:hypothetical protein
MFYVLKVNAYENFKANVHLITTSRNLFQSAGLNRLKHILRPFKSFIILF